MTLVGREELEGIVSLLISVDKELDDLRAYAEKARMEILDLARGEAAAAKEEALRRVRALAEEIVRQAQEEAKAEADRMLRKNRELLERLRARIEGKLDEAIQFTVDVLLGKKEIA
ncbi:MAG: hypothetical protein B9J98_06985 [Candidatus Terraquivivens tikiterensis]|uniref:Uncharacterized protein n=1 Tax=Candidatus Terraquivivens tikiterensis TaxID=1980982 RepID=A0A2R7Y194_9ARCH|nr:MAG: hypothetical protein B9J98_06985 [Candidatus Terraquivivens tikiterensis]